MGKIGVFLLGFFIALVLTAGGTFYLLNNGLSLKKGLDVNSVTTETEDTKVETSATEVDRVGEELVADQELFLGSVLYTASKNTKIQERLSVVIRNPVVNAEGSQVAGDFYLVLSDHNGDELDSMNLSFWSPFGGDGGTTAQAERNKFIWEMDPLLRSFNVQFIDAKEFFGDDTSKAAVEVTIDHETDTPWKRLVLINNHRLELPQ